MTKQSGGWALVTGAARRVGRAIALDLAAHGFDIIVHYHTSKDDAAQVASEIRELGRKACLAELDFTQLPLVDRLIPSLTQAFGPLAALVNNASLFVPDGSPSASQHATVNADAPERFSESFFKTLKKTDRAVVINLLDSNPVDPLFSSYNKSKLRLNALTEMQAERLAPRLRVNGVALGPIIRNARQTLAHFKQMVRETPLSTAISAEDVASAVRFLIVNRSVTGAVIPVDGGLHLKAGKV